MDFVIRLPRTTKRHDAVWVIVDQWTKSAHFVHINMTFSLKQLAMLYVREIFWLHGVLHLIISEWGSHFTSTFWRKVQGLIGTKLNFSTIFHSQSDGQSERTIQTLEDMLQVCVMDFKGTWDKYLPFMEFSYNNSYQATIGMGPYKALYRRKYRSPIHWYKAEEKLNSLMRLQKLWR